MGSGCVLRVQVYGLVEVFKRAVVVVQSGMSKAPQGIGLGKVRIDGNGLIQALQGPVVSPLSKVRLRDLVMVSRLLGAFCAQRDCGGRCLCRVARPTGGGCGRATCTARLGRGCGRFGLRRCNNCRCRFQTGAGQRPCVSRCALVSSLGPLWSCLVPLVSASHGNQHQQTDGSHRQCRSGAGDGVGENCAGGSRGGPQWCVGYGSVFDRPARLVMGMGHFLPLLRTERFRLLVVVLVVDRSRLVRSLEALPPDGVPLPRAFHPTA